MHQLRPSRLTDLGEAGVPLLILMTKAVTPACIPAIYAKPTFDALSAATATLDSDRRHWPTPVVRPTTLIT